MSQEQDIQQLLREGIEAARAGDKAKARSLFEQITEQDENNERAWMWLASVVDTEEERRVCLSNVLVINPENEKARQLMDKLDEKKRQETADEEVMPGVSRRQLMMIGGGGLAAIAVIVLLFVAITSINSSQQAAAEAEATRIAMNMTATLDVLSTQSAAAAATQNSLATPTPTERVVPTLPPTFTPTPTETPPAGAAAIVTPPPGIPGLLVGWGGRDRLSNGALEPFVAEVSGGGVLTRIGEDLGRDVRFAGNDSQRIVYSRYFSVTFDFGVEVAGIGGAPGQLIQPNQPPIFKLEQPDYCPVANRVVYIALPVEGPSTDFDETPPTRIYITDLDTNTTLLVSSDAASYTYPAFSPDCTRIAVVRTDESGANPGSDIVVLDIANGSQTPVTSDLSTFTETAPRWSADGTKLIYAAAPSNNPENHDIVMIESDGSGVPRLPVRSEFDDRYPVLSPDGQYIAFSSRRGEFYNVFILRLEDNVLWQLTSGGGDYFPGGWWQP